MTTLKEHYNNIKELIDQGHGDKKVFTCQSSSGVYDQINSAFVGQGETDMGPFDLDKPDEEFIEISIGH